MGSLFLQKQPTMDFSFPPEKFPQDISLLGAIFMITLGRTQGSPLQLDVAPLRPLHPLQGWVAPPRPFSYNKATA